MTLKQRIGRPLVARLPITKFLFDQLRVEVNAAGSAIERTFSPRRRRQLRQLSDGQHLYVNVACGPQVHPGFVNIDLFPAAGNVIRFDCRRRLPLSNESATAIKAEHFVEHLEAREELPAFLRECLRVLEPGGLLRIVVPDAERYVRAYCCGGREAFGELGIVEWPDDLPTKMDILNHVFHQWHEHRWAYDFETLAHRLGAAGFVQIERRSFRQSPNQTLADTDLQVHAPYSLYVEASRAAATSRRA